MYIHFKTLTKFILICSFCLLLHNQSFGQVNVTVTTLVAPPYRSNLYNYANQTKITLRSNQTTRVAIAIKITGDNGIVMQTPIPNNLGYFSLEANIPYLIPPIELSDYLNPYNADLSGISPDEVTQYGLPEGNYKICVTVTGLLDGLPISSTQSCSNTFKINALQPPQIIQPMCGSDQYKNGVQNIIFSWSPSPGASPTTQYTLRLVEITNPDLSPVEAMQSATTPAFFEEEISGLSFLYGPNAPFLEKGKRYAFEVTAVDKELNTRFANQGRSQVCYFTYGKEEASNLLPFVVQEKKPKTDKKIGQTSQFPGIAFSAAHIDGTLYYQYAGPNLPSEVMPNSQSQTININAQQQINIPNQTSNNQQTTFKEVKFNNQSLTFTETSSAFTPNNLTFLSTDYRNKSTSKPLPKMPIKLVVKYMIYDFTTHKRKLLSAYEVQTSNIPKNKIKLQPDQVLASGYTDDAGHFDFTFLLKDSMGLLIPNTSITIGSGEFYSTYKGSLYCVLRLMVNSQHYCSPAHDIVINPYESKTYDDLYALIKNYGLTVKTIPGTSDNTMQGPFEGLDVYILRKIVPYDLPMDEGVPNPPQGKVLSEYPTFKVIAQSKTDKNGNVKFSRLIKNLTGYDKYYIFLNSESSENLNFISLLKEYKNIRKDEESTIIEIPENAVFNNEYEYSADYVTKLNIIALPPSITGLVKQAAYDKEKGGHAIEEAKVGLFNLGILIPLKVMETNTNEEGRYWFKNIYQTYYTNNNQKIDIPYAIKASMTGYKDKTHDVAGGSGLKYGQKVKVETVFLEPKSIIGGKIIDAQTKSGVQCNVTVIGGSSVLSDPPAITFSNNTNSADISALQQTDLIQIQNLASHLDATPNTSGNVQIFKVTPKRQSGLIAVSEKPAISGVSQINTQNIQIGPSYFSLHSPSGTQKVIVDPLNGSKYFTDTFEVNLKNGLNAMSIEVIPKIHRIRLTVTEAKPQGYTLQYYNPVQQIIKKIHKAKVRVVDRTDYVLTNEVGEAKLEFGGNDNFKIEVLTPDDADYESSSKSFYNIDCSKDFKNESIALNKASRVSGKVTSEGTPVEGAKVKLNYPGKNIETTTEPDGTYTLKGLPLGKNLVIQATKNNFIGDTAVITITSTWKENVNLELTKFEEIDYSKLLGFSIEISSVKKQNSKTYITGEFTKLPRNGQIETKEENQTLKFKDIEIVAGSATGSGGLPYPVPVVLPLKTEENTVALTFNGTFFGELEDKTNGIQVQKATNETSGEIKALVSLNADNSFITNDLAFGSEKIYLMESPSSGSPSIIKALSSGAEKPYGNNGDMPLCNQDGKDIKYSIYGFNAEAKNSASKISGNKVKLNTILHAQLKNVGNSDLAVQVGDIEILHNGVVPVSKTTALNIPLEKWTLSTSKWSLSSYGFVLNEGKIKTHLADIGYTNIEIDPVSKELKYGTFNLSSLDLKGIATLNVTGNANFFYEAGHWTLAIVPKNGSCGYIPALPGMPSNQNLDVSSVFIKSNNTGDFSVVTKPFKLYNVVDYNPSSLSVYDDRLELPGSINMNIPDIPAHVGLIKYRRVGSGIEFGFQPFTFGFSTKGVDLHFNMEPNSISASGLSAKGTLSEPGLYSVNVQLNKTASKTEIVDIPGQSFPIDKKGTRKLANFDGEMHVASNKWTNFIFSGDLNGTKGANGKLTFTIKGDIVADGQSVKVDKVNTPFGNMNFTFDFANSRLTGKLEINQVLNGTGELHGSAESVVDGSGWYFCAGGKLTMKNNPYLKEMSSAILFGDYPAINDPFITKTFADYSYSKTLPTSFKQSLSGFYASGAAEYPIPYVPDLDIDLFVVSGELSVSAGGSFDLGLNFTDGGATLYTGASSFVHAHIGVGGSIGIACAGASFDTKMEFGNNGELKTDGSWYVEGISTLTLSGGAYSGYGCCNSKCKRCSKYSPVGCHKDSWNGEKSFQFKLHMGSDDNYIDVSW